MRRPKREGVDLILRTKFAVLGLVLVLLGFYELATITRLIRAYLAKPDAPRRRDRDYIPVRAYQLHCGSRYRRRSWPPRPSWDLRHIHRNSKTDPSIDHLATLALRLTWIYRLWALARFCMVEAQSDD